MFYNNVSVYSRSDSMGLCWILKIDYPQIVRSIEGVENPIQAHDTLSKNTQRNCESQDSLKFPLKHGNSLIRIRARL